MKEEIDFRELPKEPRRLFAYSYFYVLGLLFVLGFLYVTQLSDIGKNAVPPSAAAESTTVMVDLPLQAPRQLPPVDVLRAGVATPEVVARGKELFQANCISCHGENGMGDGPTAATLTIKPRNFHALTGWTNGPKIPDMYKTLEEGIVRNGMASYNYIAPADRFALIHFVRTFMPAAPIASTEELQQLEVLYQLSKGVNVPGQIPVRVATQKLIAERQSFTTAVDVIARASVKRQGPDADLFRRVVRDPLRVFAALLRDGPGTIPAGADFIGRISSNPGGMGFHTAVTRLSAPEWETLHTFILTMSTR